MGGKGEKEVVVIVGRRGGGSADRPKGTRCGPEEQPPKYVIKRIHQQAALGSAYTIFTCTRMAI